MQDFWENVSRYPRYLVAIILGVFLNAIAPLVPLFKRPSTAIALTGVIVAGLAFIAFTLRAMLGLSPV
jgi:heme/copper-type cytochrome/quinol oxidase subunit 4